jgi:hypothetical protein
MRRPAPARRPTLPRAGERHHDRQAPVGPLRQGGRRSKLNLPGLCARSPVPPRPRRSRPRYHRCLQGEGLRRRAARTHARHGQASQAANLVGENRHCHDLVLPERGRAGWRAGLCHDPDFHTVLTTLRPEGRGFRSSRAGVPVLQASRTGGGPGMSYVTSAGRHGKTCRQDVLRGVDVPVVPGAAGRACPVPRRKGQLREQVLPGGAAGQAESMAARVNGQVRVAAGGRVKVPIPR